MYKSGKREILKSLFSGDSAPLKKHLKNQNKDIYSMTAFRSVDGKSYSLRVNWLGKDTEHIENATEEEYLKLIDRTRYVWWNESEVPFVLEFQCSGVKPYTSEREVIEKYGLDSDPYGPLE